MVVVECNAVAILNLPLFDRPNGQNSAWYLVHPTRKNDNIAAPIGNSLTPTLQTTWTSVKEEKIGYLKSNTREPNTCTSTCFFSNH